MAEWTAWAVLMKTGGYVGKTGSGYVQHLKYAQLYPSKKRAESRLLCTWRGDRLVEVHLTCDEPHAG